MNNFDIQCTLRCMPPRYHIPLANLNQCIKIFELILKNELKKQLIIHAINEP
jgi:hypothetical protein